MRLRKAYFVVIVLTISAPLYAYLDPGTGSYVISVIIAGIISAGALIKIYWRKITGLISGKSATSEEEE